MHPNTTTTGQQAGKDNTMNTPNTTTKRRELTPTDGRKSFYGKAYTITTADGIETLYSYDTPIISKDAAGDLRRMHSDWSDAGKWSATTGRHIAAFLGVKLAKDAFYKLPEA